MPLQNRVWPNGEIVATPTRGALMGNRGGRIHDPETKTLLNRRWASKRWISCVLSFKGRQRAVMGKSYTELFFLDEITALASGHRPCFECRRADAKAFQQALQSAGHDTVDADSMDKALHAQRTAPRRFAKGKASIVNLPDGVMYQTPSGEFWTVKNGQSLRWTEQGYKKGEYNPDVLLAVLTPPLIIDALANGYRPL